MGLDDTITALNSHNRSGGDLERSQLSSTGEEDEQEEVSLAYNKACSGQSL